MKKIYGLLAIMTMFLLVMPQTFAQSQSTYSHDQKITVNSSDLTVDQLAKIELEKANAELQKKVDTYGKWVGVGGEVGIAVKEGLTAVVDVADKFGKTDVGKFTIYMVAWKVMGKDLIKIIIGLLFFFLFTTTLIFTYRRLVNPRRFLVENPGWLRYPKKYLVIESKYSADDTTLVAVIFIIFFFVGMWITYAVMF